MEVGTRIRIELASGVVVAAGASIAFAGPVEAGPPAEQLLPDLRTVAAGPHGLHVKRKGDGSKATLRIANRIANQGPGPVELYSTAATEGGIGDCTEGEYPTPIGADRDANQRIFEDTNGNGEFDRAGDPDGTDQVSEEPKVGCFEFHN